MPSRTAICIWTSALLTAAGASEAAALVASCPDGSITIAKKWEDVRCPGAVAVHAAAPSMLGVVRGHDSAAGQAVLRGTEAARENDLDAQLDGALARPPVALGSEAQRGLAALIARSRPQASVERDVAGLAPLRMRLAHSTAFEEQLAATLGSLPGPVLVFSLAPGSLSLGDFAPSFAQGGATYRPNLRDPHQLGWIPGPDPDHDPGASSLGYLVLPPDFDLDRPIVLFWGDAVAAAWLAEAES